MKKIPSIIFAIFLVLSCFQIEAIADSVIRVEEFGMTISVPDSYSVFTRGMNVDDPLFDKFGYKKEDMDNMFSKGNMYLDAVTYDGSEEFVITGNDVGLADFSTASDTVIKTLIKNIVGNYEENGLKIGEEVVIVKSNQTKFAAYELIYDDSYDMYGRQYATCNTGKVIFVSFHEKSYIDSQRIKEMDDIVKSIIFDSVETTAYANSSSAFTYNDSDSGSTFIVPEGWIQADFLTKPENISVKFSCEKEKGISIMYGSWDAYSEFLKSDELSQYEKAGISRQDFNMSLFEKTDMSEMLDVPFSSVSIVHYGGKTFYKAEISKESTKYGFTVSTTSTVLCTVDSGWQYIFMFTGVEDDEYYQDFEKLLRSFKVATETNNEKTYTSLSDEEKRVDYAETMLIMFAGFAVVGILVVIVSMRFKKRKKTENKQEETYSNNNEGFNFSMVAERKKVIKKDKSENTNDNL